MKAHHADQPATEDECNELLLTNDLAHGGEVWRDVKVLLCAAVSNPEASHDLIKAEKGSLVCRNISQALDQAGHVSLYVLPQSCRTASEDPNAFEHHQHSHQEQKQRSSP